MIGFSPNTSSKTQIRIISCKIQRNKKVILQDNTKKEDNIACKNTKKVKGQEILSSHFTG